MEKVISFEKLHETRKSFRKDNSNKDHIVVKGTNNILISAPHGVSQIRLGKHKASEIGSLATALYLKEHTKSFLIAKTRNNNDDANFDEISEYKNSIKSLINNQNIKYIVDIHGLASNRNCDINLGTHLGRNIQNDINSFNLLNEKLINSGFKVNIDQPFMAGSKTICGSVKNEFPNIWTIQIEIICNLTNRKENFERYKKLLDVLVEWINLIDNK
ncbi:MAG: hypothetical protein ACI4R8_02495 [Candidatus Caccovivens sp.]